MDRWCRIPVMAPQDDAREHEMRLIFNLVEPPGRTRGGLDAQLEIDGQVIPFELKSTTKSSFSTVRDFGPDHIEKWKVLHWLFAVYSEDGRELRYCYYASPDTMSDWVADKEAYTRPDFMLADRAPGHLSDSDLTQILGGAEEFTRAQARAVMKNQWSAVQYKENADLPGERYSRAAMLWLLQERCRYIILRGSTLNNPHIAESYLKQRTEPITSDQAATVRAKVRHYLAEQPGGKQPTVSTDILETD